MADATKEGQTAVAEDNHQDLSKEDPEVLKQLYEEMLLIRRFEERTSDMYTKATIGACYESIKLAKLYQLPMIFFIVDSGYGMGTSVAEGSCEPDLSKKGCSFRIHGERVDGTDVVAVREATRRLRERAEKEQE